MHALPVLPMCARLHHFCHGYSHLSKQQSWNIVHCQLITSDAESGSAGKAAAVQAEFAKAGIPTRVTKRVLKLHRHYLNWDIETKLQPALQLWLQELGAEQLSTTLASVHARGVQGGVLVAGFKRSDCCKGTTKGANSHDKGDQGCTEYL